MENGNDRLRKGRWLRRRTTLPRFQNLSSYRYQDRMGRRGTWEPGRRQRSWLTLGICYVLAENMHANSMSMSFLFVCFLSGGELIYFNIKTQYTKNLCIIQIKAIGILIYNLQISTNVWK